MESKNCEKTSEKELHSCYDCNYERMGKCLRKKNNKGNYAPVHKSLTDCRGFKEIII